MTTSTTSLILFSCFQDAVSKIKWNTVGNLDESKFENVPITLKDLELGAPIEKGCSAVVYAARLIEDKKDRVTDRKDTVEASVEERESTLEVNAQINDAATNYPLALKMMFNYDVQSSAMAILRAMYRETVPARKYYNPVGFSSWELR